ncbi:hypothetical protein GCM10022262_36910 [Georgenia daeguensis]|uniref:Methyltransferase type 11 domain-containing protein n=1 Tax=Georgenia daeguensis TaxID=908355 RepID=A0ABP6UNR3_9MICO
MGILRLAEGDEPWEDVPEQVRAAALRATSADALVEQMVDGDQPWPGDVRRRLLHPAGGAAATLVPLTPGAAVLDLGTGWSTLARALSTFGAEVTSADWVYARLRLETLLNDAPAGRAVHLDLGRALPWPDRTFDAVFVDTAEIRRLLGNRADADAVLSRVLAEVRRVLGDDGVAVVGTHNRLSDLPGEIRPAGRRRAGAREVRAALRSPWDDGPLRAAGLRPARVIAALPRRDAWRWMVPQERLREHLRAQLPPSSLRRRAVRAAAAAGGARWLARDYYVLARTAHDGATPRTLGEVLAGTSEQPAPVTMALSDARVAVLGSRDFVKVPLSAEQQEQVVAEVRKTHEAAGTALGAFTLEGARVEHWGAVPYAVYPLVRSRGSSDLHAARAALQGVLGEVGGGEMALLRETAFWARLVSPRGQADAAGAHAHAVRDHVLATCADARVPVGATHGDLHAGNVLLPATGGPQLVDWNRFETNNPLLLDGVFAAAEEFRAAHRATFAEALLAFVDGTMGGRTAERARALLGDLRPLEAAAVVFLDRAMTYGQPRPRYRPWTLPPLRRTGEALAARLAQPQER